MGELNMIKICVLVFSLFILGACGRQLIPKETACETTTCPGYGLQSGLAACADFVEIACNGLEKCDSEKFDGKECKMQGLTFCLDLKEIDVDKMYSSCIPTMLSLTDCQVLNEGVPNECIQVMK